MASEAARSRSVAALELGKLLEGSILLAGGNPSRLTKLLRGGREFLNHRGHLVAQAVHGCADGSDERDHDDGRADRPRHAVADEKRDQRIERIAQDQAGCERHEKIARHAQHHEKRQHDDEHHSQRWKIN